MAVISTEYGHDTTAAEVARGIDLSGRRVDRHRRRVRDRRRDGARAGGHRRRRDARGARPRRRRAHGRRDRRVDGQFRRARRAPRPRRPGVGRGLRRGLDGPAARARQQRRRDGVARDAHARGLGAAVRHQPPRPLRARARPARRARGRRRRAHRRGQLRGAPPLARRVRRHPLRAARRTTRGSPTASPRRPTCCSRSRRRAAGPATASPPTRSCRAGSRRNLQRHMDPAVVAGWSKGEGTGGMQLKTPEQGAATSVLLATSPALDGVGGRYFEDCNEAPVVANDSTASTRRARLRTRPRGREAALGGLARDARVASAARGLAQRSEGIAGALARGQAHELESDARVARPPDADEAPPVRLAQEHEPAVVRPRRRSCA